MGLFLQMTTRKCLIAFDFDHTIIDDNSDIRVQDLAPGKQIPSDIKNLYSSNGWTEYMAAIFSYVHKAGTKQENIEECMKKIKLVPGMHELFQFLDDNGFEVIIISDSNSVFIDIILKHVGLHGIVNKVFTNPAKFDSTGCLTIKYYHTQDWCSLSSRNLCKGHILEEYIAERAQDGHSYDFVAFVGDGSNDLCPSLRLRQQDAVFVRKGYRLHGMLSQPSEHGNIKANLTIWESGVDIQEALNELMKGLKSKC